MNTLTPMTTLINAMTRLSADLNSVGYGLESDLKYTIKSARADVEFFINEARKECEASLADYLESLGLSPTDTQELMAQDWDYQDAEGLSLKCLGCYGSFDWKLMAELLEAAEDCDEDVLSAGLAIGIPANEVAEKHQGQWDNAEDYAYDYWESCGLLAEVPESARNYLNWEAIARDMLLNGDVVESNKHYFHTC